MRSRWQTAAGMNVGASGKVRNAGGAQPDVCVVHLVRHANGLDAFERFLDSYRRHPAGTSHALAILLKGFADPLAAEPYRALAADVCDHWVTVPDEGFDIGSYREAALALPHRKLAFLNSFSVIRSDGWLELMESIERDPGVGAVGASGSWGSRASYVRFSLGHGLGGPYRRVFEDRAETERAFASLAPPDPAASSTPPGGLVRTLLSAKALVDYTAAYRSFPAPHLRTNCWLIDRDLWLRLCRRAPPDKPAAYRFESGRRGMTARLQTSKLRVLVAGRDGRAYGMSEWPASRTFWQRDQGNLLVEDNQTRDYQQGNPVIRHTLSSYAWGPQADPGESDSSEYL